MPSVVVTGAGSGIGATAALRLERLGWRVFAGVHDPKDGEILDRQSSERLTVLLLDVTDLASIKSFAAKVDELLGDEGLTALVDNAAEGVAGPLETLPIDSLRHQLEVNVVGQVSVTQQLLPLLRRQLQHAGRTAAHGEAAAELPPRVVFVGSIGGLVAVQFAGAYHASKYAIEAICDAWRQELAADGIHVTIVEPGPVSTPIWSKAAHSLDALPINDRYTRQVDAVRERLQRMSKESDGPGQAVDLIEHAVTSRRPHTRYTGGLAATVVPKVRRLLPDRVFDRLAQRATEKSG